MRAQPSKYELVAPGSLDAVLHLLAREPETGSRCRRHRGDGSVRRRPARAPKLVSLWGIPELRLIERTAQEMIIAPGAPIPTSALIRN